MAKGKNATKEKDSKKCYTRSDFEIRPVTKDDKWCKFRKDENPNPEAPYGWIMEIPNYRDGMKIEPFGCVVRSKVFQKTLMLQIVIGKKQNGEGRLYGITMQLPGDSVAQEKSKRTKKVQKGKKRMKKKRRYLNICQR